MKKIIAALMLMLSFTVFAEQLFQVTVTFNTLEEAQEYISWMSGQGEQDMSIWMEENMPSLDKVPEYDYKNLVIDFTKE